MATQEQGKYPTPTSFIRYALSVAQENRLTLGEKRKVLGTKSDTYGVDFINLGVEAFVFRKVSDPERVVRIFYDPKVLDTYGEELLQESHALARAIFPDNIPDTTFFSGAVHNVNGRNVRILGNIQTYIPDTSDVHALSETTDIFVQLQEPLRRFRIPLFFDPSSSNLRSGIYIDTIVPFEPGGSIDYQGFSNYLREKGFAPERIETILNQTRQFVDHIRERRLALQVSQST